MKYTEIFKIIKDTFDETDNLQASKEKGRIIISMKQEKNVWTREQKEYLDGMENRITSKIDNTNSKLDNTNNLVLEVLNKVNMIIDCPTIKNELSELDQTK